MPKSTHLFVRSIAIVFTLTLCAGFCLGQGEHIKMVGQIGGGSLTVTLQGQTAYVGLGASLAIMDVSIPGQPRLKGKITLPGLVSGIAVDGSLAYVADDISGFCIVDISQPTSPILRGSLRTPYRARNVAVSGHLAFVTDADYDAKAQHALGHLNIIDISDPANPGLKGRYAFDDLAKGVAVDGNKVFVASGGLHVIDASDPANPKPLGRFPITIGISGDLVYLNQTVYLAASGLKILDVSDPAKPSLIGSGNTLAGRANGVAIQGSRAYLTDSYAGLAIFDISNPTNPQLVSGTNTGWANDVTVSGDTIYVADYWTGFKEFEYNGISMPGYRGHYAAPAYTYSAAVKDQFVYVADWFNGLIIIDISQPKAPIFHASCDLTPPSAQVRNVKADNDIVYMMTENSRLRLIDVRNPSAPIFCGSYEFQNWTTDYIAFKNRIYVSNGNTIKILSADHYSTPTLRTSLTLDGSTGALAINGNLLYVACHLEDSTIIKVIDVSDPDHPQPQSQFTVPYTISKLALADQTLYMLCNGGTQLLSVGVGNPQAPLFQCNHALIDMALDIAVDGNLVYLAGYNPYTGQGHLEILDLENPRQLSKRGAYTTPSIPYSVAVSGGLAYVTDLLGGLYILRYTPPVKVFSPNGGENLKSGALASVHWQTDVTSAGTSVRFELWNSRGRVADLGYSWSAEGEDTTEFYLPLVPEGSDYRLRAVSVWNPSLYDESDAPFTISGGIIRVMMPNGGTVWRAGEKQPVWWQLNPLLAGQSVKLELRRGGFKVANLGLGWDPDGEGVNMIKVPPVLPESDYRVRATSVWNPSWFADSDPFTIKNDGPITPPERNAVERNNWIRYR